MFIPKCTVSDAMASLQAPRQQPDGLSKAFEGPRLRQEDDWKAYFRHLGGGTGNPWGNPGGVKWVRWVRWVRWMTFELGVWKSSIFGTSSHSVVCRCTHTLRKAAASAASHVPRQDTEHFGRNGGMEDAASDSRVFDCPCYGAIAQVWRAEGFRFRGTTHSNPLLSPGCKLKGWQLEFYLSICLLQSSKNYSNLWSSWHFWEKRWSTWINHGILSEKSGDGKNAVAARIYEAMCLDALQVELMLTWQTPPPRSPFFMDGIMKPSTRLVAL